MPISQRIYQRAGFLLLALSLTALLLVSLGSVSLVQRNRQYADWVNHAQEVLDRIARVRWQVRTAESGQRGFLLTGDPQYLDAYDSARLELRSSLQRLRALVQDNPEEEARAAQLSQLVEQKLAELADTVTAARSGDRMGAISTVKTDIGLKLMRQITSTLDTMVGAESRLRELHSVQYEEGNQAVFVLTVVGTALTVALGGGIWLLTRLYFEQLSAAQAGLELANVDLERRVDERTVELREANEELQRFAYIVSHDLRSPLVNVMGFTGELDAALAALRAQVEKLKVEQPALLDGSAVQAIEDDLPEAIGFIRASAMKMDRLIKAILQLSREGRRVLAPQPVDLQELVQGILATLKSLTLERGAEITVEPLPSLVTDRLGIEQILSNLIENALKYLSPSRPGRISISGRLDGPLVEITVADNGRGIDPRDRERIFELFRRAGDQDQPGEGIGLAHVRALARRLGGTVTCVSEVGLGSSFTVTLPRTPKKEQA